MLVPKLVKKTTTFTMHTTRMAKRFVHQKEIAMIAAPILKIADVITLLLNI
jgi:hypothetical protein